MFSHVNIYQIFPAPSVEKTILSPTEQSWRVFKSIWPCIQRIVLGYLLYSIFLYNYLYTITTLFWLLWLCRKFWIRKWDFQLCSPFSRLFNLFIFPWDSIWILGWIFPILPIKYHEYFDGDCFGSVDCSG